MVCWCGIGHKITEEGYNVSFLALLCGIGSWTYTVCIFCIHELWDQVSGILIAQDEK